jgi:hypothetical protein
MPRYALVEFSTMTVFNVDNRATPLTAPTGFRNIVESDWTPGDDPVVNDIWDGAIPAGFAPPPPPAIDDVEKSAQDIVEEIRAKANEMLGRADALEAKLG